MDTSITYFEHQGTFAEFVLDLVATDADVDAEQGKSLVFAFEVFESLQDLKVYLVSVLGTKVLASLS